MPAAVLGRRDGRAAEAQLTLDGMHLDLRAPEGAWLAHLTRRGWMVRCPAYEGASLAAVPTREAEGLPGSGEHGFEEAETRGACRRIRPVK